MSVARTGALPNAYKYFTVAVNSFEQKQMEGFVGHESQTGTASFYNVAQLVRIFSYVFDRVSYPMSTVELRQFKRKNLKAVSEQPVEFFGPGGGPSPKGRLATFLIHVKYRYHATWQGDVTCLESGTTYAFESFLQLMKVFDRVLGGEPPKAAEHRAFANEFELMEQLDAMFSSAGHSARETVVMPRKPGAGGGPQGPLTFMVRLLFDSNATWQGTVCWKEKGEQESFRSFLELLMMIEGAAGQSIDQEEETPGGTAENAS